MRGLMSIFSLPENEEPVVSAQGQDLFGLEDAQDSFKYEQSDIDFLLCYFSNDFKPSVITNEKARELFGLSPKAFDILLHALMSELPIETEIVNFAKKVLAAAESGEGGLEDKQHDRGDADTLAVLNAAAKVQFEVNRMMGLLRFSPNEQGFYTARCAPDHFILPALGKYFISRFGETGWQIIDEKRNLTLSRRAGEAAKLQLRAETAAFASNGDEWEELWRHYHKTINNESRNKPNLQRQFMPLRYQKYLPEI